MSGGLFRKELRGLRPYALVALAVVLIDVIDVLLTTVGELGMPHRLDALSSELALVQLLQGFAMGTALLVREIDNGTLGFLDGLPLTRRAIFTAKIKAAMLVLLIVPAGLLLLNAAIHLANRGSLDHTLHPALLLTMFALSVLVSAVALGAGMLLGFMRYLAWLLLALCAIGVKLLEDSAPSLAAALNTADLLTLRFTGASWQLPVAAIWTQLGVALGCGTAAYLLFRSAGSVRSTMQRLGRRRRWFVAPGVIVMAVAAAAGIGVLAQRSKDDRGAATAGHEAANAVDFTPIATGHATTRHYTFSYPALSSARVHPLVAEADAIFDKVAALLQVEGGASIDVDLSGSTENHAGTAYQDRIRMRAGADAGDTLAHETAHVLAGRLTGGEQGSPLDGMMVFNEGLAEWVETRIKNQPGVDRDHELAAAIVSARRLVTPRQLTDQRAFSAAVDDNLKYPLGAIFIERLVGRHGPQAPKTVLQAMGQPDFPRDLQGYALWQTAFQLAGFDLDLVLDDYARHLKQLESRFAPQIAALPRPRGSLVALADDDEGEGEGEGGYAVALRFDRPLPTGAMPLVRFRPGTVGDSSQYRTRFADVPDDDDDNGKSGEHQDNYRAGVPAKMITRGEVCFQPGIKYLTLIVYEPWVCLPVGSASAD